MKFLEVLGKILIFLIGAGAVVALVWAICCAVSPTISEKTEDLFNGTKQEEVTEETDNNKNNDTPDTNAQFVFGNDLIKITLGC